MFAKINNGQLEKYPYTLGMLRKDNPNCSFPKIIDDETLAGFNVVRVSSTTKPEDDYRKNFSVTAEQIDGSWVEKWIATDVSPEELQSRTENQERNIRSQRDQLLSDCDWTQVADAPVDSSAWATYRQALRDLPDQDGFPWTVSWPLQPN